MAAGAVKKIYGLTSLISLHLVLYTVVTPVKSPLHAFRIPEKLVHNLHTVMNDSKSSPLFRALSQAVLRDNPSSDKDNDILPPYHKKFTPAILNLAILQVCVTNASQSNRLQGSVYLSQLELFFHFG
jgi:hypothetical protein